MSIADNLLRVRERIARAAQVAGRRAEEITLVGVTKYVGPREAADLFRSGCHDLGESRPQELWDKHREVALGTGIATPPIRWHLVGHLQRNKVHRTLPLVHLIHSVDSERLLAAINEAAKGEQASQRPPIKVLLEVNTSGETAKHGLAADAVEPLLTMATQYSHVAICGLMTMAALEGGADVAARDFAALRELQNKLQLRAPEGMRLDELSMGMSGDFEVAIREGATIVRIGTLLWQ